MLGTFFTISPENITAMIGYVHTLFSDMSLLILLIVGVGLGLLIIRSIISALK